MFSTFWNQLAFSLALTTAFAIALGWLGSFSATHELPLTPRKRLGDAWRQLTAWWPKE